jgi:hypothetical protein
MIKERELLERVLTSELWSVQEELQAEIKELLASPPKREPLSNEVIEDERVKSPWHLRTFKAGIKFAEKMHGIGVDNENHDA